MFHGDSFELTNEEYIDIVENYIQNVDFHPVAVSVSDPNQPVSRITKNDEQYLKLKEKYPEDVVREVIRACRELDTWNPSGRYPVMLVWNYFKKREMTCSEMCMHLFKHLKATRYRK